MICVFWVKKGWEACYAVENSGAMQPSVAETADPNK